MAYVKYTGFFAGPFVRVANAQVCVLDGHLEAAKGNHLGAMLEMEIVEAGFA